MAKFTEDVLLREAKTESIAEAMRRILVLGRFSTSLTMKW
jgi:hypothetical protein